MRREVYSGRLKLDGEESLDTLREANNLASLLKRRKHFEEAKSLLRKIIPVARRLSGEHVKLTLTMKKVYADTLCDDPGATLDDLRESVTTLEEIERTARRVLGGAHPLTAGIEATLRRARVILQAREAGTA